MSNNYFMRLTSEISNLDNGVVLPFGTFLDRLLDRIDALEAKVAALEAKPDGYERDDDRIGNLEVRIDDIESDMRDHLDKYDTKVLIEEVLNDATFTVSVSL